MRSVFCSGSQSVYRIHFILATHAAGYIFHAYKFTTQNIDLIIIHFLELMRGLQAGYWPGFFLFLGVSWPGAGDDRPGMPLSKSSIPNRSATFLSGAGNCFLINACNTPLLKKNTHTMAQNELWDKQQKIQIQIIEINTAVFFITKICNPQSELQRHVRWF